MNSLIDCTVYYHFEEVEDLVTKKLAKNLIINCIENKEYTGERWFYTNNLHVHHTYYQKGKLPWEDPDNSLLTLCRSCHKNLHTHGEIPVLNELGDEIGKLTYCYRCFGAGSFPQYSHIQDGICFRCKGARYEEFIN